MQKTRRLDAFASAGGKRTPRKEAVCIVGRLACAKTLKQFMCRIAIRRQAEARLIGAHGLAGVEADNAVDPAGVVALAIEEPLQVLPLPSISPRPLKRSARRFTASE